MTKTILVTGSTDGIGLATAKRLVAQGHSVLLHGRNAAKLEAADREVTAAAQVGRTKSYVADLSDLTEVAALADQIKKQHDHLDVVINNAGVFKTPSPITEAARDVRFVVNTLAPYLLTRRLLPLMDIAGCVVNLSSAAQAPVNLDALAGQVRLDDMEAYAQSKLALTMWNNGLAQMRTDGPIMIAVNPGSLLASKMVKQGFGVAGHDLGIGAGILTRAALSDEFAEANGKYFDNDEGRFGPPHRDALDAAKCKQLVEALDALLAHSIA
ncbi:MAG: SDR family NAD(P)-dependent oxidoreductase [Hyphomicrobiaceae bacterium TMED74]|nr:oxidoreductase [Filomicrobium sp.]RPG40985.1 MAG: SDR family NAD(P)-dependent oxidoreductase [Hyphomicrobiaceae bacterium TMED74]